MIDAHHSCQVNLSRLQLYRDIVFHLLSLSALFLTFNALSALFLTHRDLESGLLRANTTDTDVTPLQYIRSDGGEIDIIMWHIDGFLERARTCDLFSRTVLR